MMKMDIINDSKKIRCFRSICARNPQDYPRAPSILKYLYFQQPNQSYNLKIKKLKSLLINSLINFCNIMWNYIQVVRAIKQASAKKITYWEVAQGLIQKDGIQGRLFPNFKTKLIVCRELSIL
jgi:hypothetical protein